MESSWLKDFIAESVPIWKAEPVVFTKEVLRMNCDDWQKQVLNDLRDNPYVAVKSGQGVGKTAVEAASLLWFLTCFSFPRIVATAPTKQQLHDILWSEIDKWMNNNPLLPMILRWTKTYVYMQGYEKRWFAVARTATKPENMQGFHEDNMLFIVDEAPGVSEPIMEAVMGTLAGKNNKLLMMGNPTKNSGMFHDAFTSDRALFKCHTVSSEDVKRTNKDSIEAMKRKYGENSNVVRVRIKGEFPLQEDDVFIPISWIEQSIKTEISDETLKALGRYKNEDGTLLPPDFSGVANISIGCDVARFGDDKTCIGYRVNEYSKIFKKVNGQDTTWTASTLAQLYLHLKDRFRYKERIAIKVDDGGVGGGVVDQLRKFKFDNPKLYEQMEVVAVNFGQPIKHKYYADTTTYMMAVLKDLIEPTDESGKEKIPEIVLPNDDDLVGELSVRKYGFLSNGKQKVESKEEMKKRGLHSPDEADCMLLVFLPVKFGKERRTENGSAQ